MLEVILEQAFFQVGFFEMNPQCKGCKHVDFMTMDWHYYEDWIKEHQCSACEKCGDLNFESNKPMPLYFS